MNDEFLNELYRELAKILQKKYKHMNEVSRMTKEMADGLSRNDTISVELLIAMRGNELEEMSLCDSQMNLLLESAPEDIRQEVWGIVSGRNPEGSKSEEVPMKEKIINIAKDIRNVHKQTVEVDRHMSTKIAGDESFYHK